MKGIRGSSWLVKTCQNQLSDWGTRKKSLLKMKIRPVGVGFKGFERTPFEVNNGGLKTQTVDFQLLANSGGMENKL